jgi:hypothetical protein
MASPPPARLGVPWIGTDDCTHVQVSPAHSSPVLMGAMEPSLSKQFVRVCGHVREQTTAEPRLSRHFPALPPIGNSIYNVRGALRPRSTRIHVAAAAPHESLVRWMFMCLSAWII